MMILQMKQETGPQERTNATCTNWVSQVKEEIKQTNTNI